MESPGSGCAGPRAGSDPAVQMNEAGNRELLLTGEAARGLAGDAIGGIVGAVRIAPLAPGVIGQGLHHPSTPPLVSTEIEPR
jgi:hypothetical protein